MKNEEILEKIDQMATYPKVRMYVAYQEKENNRKEQKPIYDYFEKSKGTYVDEIFELEDMQIVKAIKGEKIVYYGFIEMKPTNNIWYSFDEALIDLLVKKRQGHNTTYTEGICRMLEIPMLTEPKDA